MKWHITEKPCKIKGYKSPEYTAMAYLQSLNWDDLIMAITSKMFYNLFMSHHFFSFLLFFSDDCISLTLQRYCGDRYTDHDSDSKSNVIKTSKQTSKTCFTEILLFNYFPNFKLAFTCCHSYICYYNTSPEKAQSYWSLAMRTSFPQWGWNIFKH